MSRIVVKIGSSLLAHEDGRLKAEWLDGLAQDVRDLRAAGVEIMIVSSGAIAVGRRLLGLAKGPRNKVLRLEESQAAAAAGLPCLVASFGYGPVTLADKAHSTFGAYDDAAPTVRHLLS